jgi:hypothetical protein
MGEMSYTQQEQKTADIEHDGDATVRREKWQAAECGRTLRARMSHILRSPLGLHENKLTARGMGEL